jgi:bacteriocin biosynthesis cyclodehydratase domain-containing protein
MDPADSRLVGFKRHLRAETVPAEAVYLISERGVTALSGSCIERLAPLLDGTRSFAQLARDLSAELATTEIVGLLQRLAEAGLLDLRQPSGATEAVSAIKDTAVPAAVLHDLAVQDIAARDHGAAAFWSLAGLDADEAAGAISAATVEILALDGAVHAAAAVCAASGLTPCTAATAALVGAGAAPGVAAPGVAGPAVSLVLCEDYLDPRLDAINRRQLAHGRPWLLAKPSGTQAWIGPLFRPGAGPCWACLATRLEGNREETHLMRRVLGAQGRAFPAGPQTSLTPSRAAALHLAVGEVVKWLAGLRDEGQQAVYILDTVRLQGRHHRVQRRPQCPHCGDPGLVAAQAARPPGAAPGSPPSHDPLDRYGHLVDPVTGIVAELRRDERCPPFQHAFVSGRNRAMSASTVAGIRAGARHASGGGGVTEAEAKTSALCEAIERYCGTRQGDEATVRASYRGLGRQAVHPAAAMLFDSRQYRDRAGWNEVCARFHWVPEPFDETAEADWTPLWSLLSGERKLLPTAMLYYNPGAGAGRGSADLSVLADSNGNAAGASLGDAVVRGFLELTERDAVALWWYNRTRQPEVDLVSFEDPWITGLTEQYRRLGRELWALDLTTDLGIPVVAAISRRLDGPAEDIAFGFGASFDPARALRRALTELGQLLPPATDGDSYRSADPFLASWWASATLASQPYLAPASGQAARANADYPAVPAGLDGIRAAARRAGLDILVLDQTRPDIGMPVVKVVVPGLRHFWPRFAPGRLFDVPVRLGRLPRPTAYADLNPIPLYV